MNSRIVTFIIVLLALHAVTFAQDFDADSIYYTPIPKGKLPESEKKERINPFKEVPTVDTTRRERFIGYFFNLQVGSLVACSDCLAEKEVTITASTVHGVTVGRKFRIGGGIGFDSFSEWNTMPLFGSASWDVWGSKNTSALFVQFNYGWSLPWRTEDVWEGANSGVDGGQMVYGMGGLRLKYHDMTISFTLGGKYQYVSSYIEIPTFYYDFNGRLLQGASSRTTINETMKRFVIAVSIGWK